MRMYFVKSWKNLKKALRYENRSQCNFHRKISELISHNTLTEFENGATVEKSYRLPFRV